MYFHFLCDDRGYSINPDLEYDFHDGSDAAIEYEYDQNGNMKKDFNKGINITYNYLNLPVTIKWDANNPADKRKIEWLYNATGSKLRKTVYNVNGDVTDVINYANGFVYKNNAGQPQLDFFPMSEGRILSTGSSYKMQYFLKDHLGNTRMTIEDDGTGVPQIVQKDFYYPFGLTIHGTVDGDANKFLYNGKELEDEHGLNWYHYGVRYGVYPASSGNPQLGRWHTMDPADEFHSPYLYVGNNPVKFVDPDGAQADNAVGNPMDLLCRELLDYSENFWDYAANVALDAAVATGDFVSDASNIGVIGLTIGGFFQPELWAVVPTVGAVGTGGDVVSTSAQWGKYANGTGTKEEAVDKTIETGVNVVTSMALNSVGKNFVKETSFIRSGKTVYQFVNNMNGRFVSNNFGNGFNAIRDVIAIPISTAVSNQLKK
jgi:RHS repeat-associated protein